MKNPHLPRGWGPLSMELVEDLIRLGWDRRVLQIKEKFGTLRVYISQREEALVDRAIATRERSATICQGCGGPGTLLEVRGRWDTLCDACRALQRAERGRA